MSAVASSRSRRCASRASFRAMLILLTKSALLCAACASSTLDGTLVPARSIWLIITRPTPGQPSNFPQSPMIRTAKSKVRSTISLGGIFPEPTAPASACFIYNFEFLIPLSSEDKEALRSRKHQPDDQQRIKNHPVIAKLAQRFGEHREQHGGDDDAHVVAHAPKDDHHHDLDGFVEAESLRRDVLLEVRVNSAC